MKETAVNKHYTFQEYLEKFSSIQDSYDYYFEQQKEIDKLHSIIKEVREFIYECNDGKQGINYRGCSKLLEMLGSDKE